MAKKRTTIMLLVLIGLCSGLSHVQVRPAASTRAKVWITAEVNLLHVRDQAVHYYQGIRLIYDFARQVRQLQEKEHAFRSAPGTTLHDRSMRSPTSLNKAVPESPVGRLPLNARSE